MPITKIKIFISIVFVIIIFFIINVEDDYNVGNKSLIQINTNQNVKKNTLKKHDEKDLKRDDKSNLKLNSSDQEISRNLLSKQSKKIDTNENKAPSKNDIKYYSQDNVKKIITKWNEEDEKIIIERNKRLAEYNGNYDDLMNSEEYDPEWAPVMERKLSKKIANIIQNKYTNLQLVNNQCMSSICKLTIDMPIDRQEEISNFVLFDLIKNIDPDQHASISLDYGSGDGDINFYILRGVH